MASSTEGTSSQAQQPRREFFYVGGEYVDITINDKTSQYMAGQMYVERLTPAITKQSTPVVFIHGLGQTGTNWLQTPDGRPGWAPIFLDHGYEVYIIDQPQRGRSGWLPSVGKMWIADTGSIQKVFTNTSSHSLWPQAHLHTQWPGTGQPGDPIFDAFFATQVQFQTDPYISEQQNGKALAALLDKIGGQVHIVAHSQAGTYAWKIGDLRPQFVKSIVALEPAGPPFEQTPLFPGPNRAWGLTHCEIRYEPDAGPEGVELKTVRRAATEEIQIEYVMQAEPAKKLVNLANVRVLVVTGEASYHAPYDFAMVEYLRQAGVQAEYMALWKEGIRGNGHMFILEKNNHEIAEKVLGWLSGL